MLRQLLVAPFSQLYESLHEDCMSQCVRGVGGAGSGSSLDWSYTGGRGAPRLGRAPLVDTNAG